MLSLSVGWSAEVDGQNGRHSTEKARGGPDCLVQFFRKRADPVDFPHFPAFAGSVIQAARLCLLNAGLSRIKAQRQTKAT
jgi:hypothetical protein